MAGATTRPWAPRTAVPELRGNDVHLWLVDLEREKPGLASLSEAELARADAFRFDIHRQRFVVGRTVLREILGAYLDRDPAAIDLVDGPNGRPEVAGSEPLRFNLAHCEDLALVAVAQRDVGVDLELVDRSRRPHWRGIASRFFHVDEFSALGGAEGEAAWIEFLRIWTLKEACLKAAGFGLVVDPRSFSVAAVVDGRSESATVAGREWRCAELRPADRAIAALAVETA